MHCPFRLTFPPAAERNPQMAATMEQPQKIRPHVRWMIRADTPMVLDIERASFERPWDEDDIVRLMRERNTLFMVAEHGGWVVGFYVYELHKTWIQLLNIAVAQHHLRRGIGSAMMAKLRGKLSSQRRTRITLEVRESNLDAQLFFRSQGFRAVSVMRGFYDDCDEDAYVMVLRHQPAYCNDDELCEGI
jgi:[ribosomal protein S18]-alanine N-acetyltransferase